MRMGRTLMDTISILGLVAGGFSTFALAPQVIKIWKTKQVNQLSIHMLIAMIIGSSLWLVYGSFRDDVAIIVANVIALVFQTYMIAMYMLHGRI